MLLLFESHLFYIIRAGKSVETMEHSRQFKYSDIYFFGFFGLGQIKMKRKKRGAGAARRTTTRKKRTCNKCFVSWETQYFCFEWKSFQVKHAKVAFQMFNEKCTPITKTLFGQLSGQSTYRTLNKQSIARARAHTSLFECENYMLYDWARNSQSNRFTS